MRRTSILFALLTIATAARLMLQVAAMPPYAGLDEGYHVARLAFVRAEGRNPTIHEPSVPPYLAGNLRGDGLLPSFAVLGERWPEVVSARGRNIAVERAFSPEDLRPYVVPNYEVQQPSVYYSLVAPLGRGSALAELRAWRLAAAFFALAIVVASAVIGFRYFGSAGILGAALIVAFPTWQTLVVRAGNDSLACAFAAVAIAITVSAPRRAIGIIAEAVMWAGAVATKLYTWPIAIVFPILWRRQGGSRARFAVVTAFAVIAAILTLHDLSTRTRNPLGHFGFDPVTATATPKPIAWLEMLKITIASFVWTSGQHWDAMKPAAMALYFGPILIAVAAAIVRQWKSDEVSVPAIVGVSFAALATFAIAQVVGAAAFIHQARAAGLALPHGGKEGWYWYALAPIFGGVFLSLVMRRWKVVAVWIVAWDIVITEGALLHDWSGTSSPAHPSALFRWGPLQMPFTAWLDTIGIGPLASHLVSLRMIHLSAIATLFILESLLQRTTDDDRNSASSN